MLLLNSNMVLLNLPTLCMASETTSFVQCGCWQLTGHSLCMVWSLKPPSYPMWLLKPSFLIKSDGTVPQFDVNALAEWNQKIFAGVTYRYQDAVAALVGYKVGDLTISYAYDFTTNGLKEPKVGGSQGTHEIYLAYCMKPPTPPKPPVYKDVTWL